LLDAEDLAERDPHRVRRLRRGIDDNLVEPVVAIGQDGAAFHRRAGLPVHAVFAGDGDLGGARRGLDVAALDRAFEIEVVAPALMHEMPAAAPHLMRACACGLRKNATSRMPGRRISGTNSPRPSRCRASSRRNTDAPMPRAVVPSAALMIPCLALRPAPPQSLPPRRSR